MITIHLVAAARPNFMKIAPLYHALSKEPWCSPKLIHTGQHYDYSMSQAFFNDLGLPAPDFHLGVGSGTHAEQTAGVMVAYEKVCLESAPDCVVVAGDVNSTMACTITAKKLHLMVAHLEAGLRSGDRDMPEEINRIVTDSISDLLLTPSEDADLNLQKEGVRAEQIERVGNIMIDSYVAMESKIAASEILEKLGFGDGGYGVVTIHRPANTDTREALAGVVENLLAVSDRIPVVFPVHPRTRKMLDEFRLLDSLIKKDGIVVSEPLGYVDFMGLVVRSRFVMTDSGGVQEESTYLGIPCITLRDTTERPTTISIGTNRLAGIDDINACVQAIIDGRWPGGRVPDLWDGKTAGRVVECLRKHIL